ncbi:hypothetical protein [Agromyces sp. NBRC 114283]|uniref:hypothetical protein n=1 Tax=Agromyces sp. NBRC 114283 TaxID=2994521 RepID=UPI0024A52961|nr:hypothetical protein [Agromyces sp. NBRC 114283]GLU91357.1 hypothetical protein Agsp01_36120 [Agromyces sp. NBRC 114283]
MRINWGKAVAAVVAVGLTSVIAAGAIAAVSAAQTPDAEPATVATLDYGAEYDRASAVATSTADRDARVAEATRVAAEQAAAQAAAAEAARVATEQQPVGEDSDPGVLGGDPEGEPAPWVPSEDPNNRNGGDWDTSGCASGRFESGPDGTPICVG